MFGGNSEVKTGDRIVNNKGDKIELLPPIVKYQIISFLSINHFSKASCACRYFKKCWYTIIMEQHFYPKDCLIVQPQRARRAIESAIEQDSSKGNNKMGFIIQRLKELFFSTNNYYNTLMEAMEKVNSSQGLLHTIILAEGDHHLLTAKDSSHKLNYLETNNSLAIQCPVKIVGAPGVDKGRIIIFGGIEWNTGENQKFEDSCLDFWKFHLENVTLRNKSGYGLVAQLPFTIKNVIIEECGKDGIFAKWRTAIGECKDLEVRYCKGNGIKAAFDAEITLLGRGTLVHDNCSRQFGYHIAGLLCEHGKFTTIRCIYPLTKEIVSTNNTQMNNVGQYQWASTYCHNFYATNGSNVDISEIRIKNVSKADSVRSANGVLHVPKDIVSLEDAYEKILLSIRPPTKIATICIKKYSKPKYTKIVLSQGIHFSSKNKQTRLAIHFPLTIVGEPNVNKKKIIVIGGFHINNKHIQGIQGNVHFENMTIRNYNNAGVSSSSSFSMKDIIIERCGTHGVVAKDKNTVATCTNVEILECGNSGILSINGGSFIFAGLNTVVRDNCTTGMRGFQFQLFGNNTKDSNICLIPPLKKSDVFKGNHLTKLNNNGDLNQIKTIVEQNQDGETKINNGVEVGVEVGGDDSRCYYGKDSFIMLPYFMRLQVISFLPFKDFSLVHRICHYFKKDWNFSRKYRLYPKDCLIVPKDCKTLRTAMQKVESSKGRLTTVILDEGQHHIEPDNETNCESIKCSVNIFGAWGIDKSKIVVLGGFKIIKNICGNVHLGNMSIRPPISRKGLHGVMGLSSFTLENVVLKGNGGDHLDYKHGVFVDGAANHSIVARCKNVQVSQFGGSGMFASNGATIILSGTETKVNENLCYCSSYTCYNAGLNVDFRNSTIQLCTPLKKEVICVNNGKDRNWKKRCGRIGEDYVEGLLRIPKGSKSLRDAIKLMKDSSGTMKLQKIILSEGEHQMPTYAKISSALKIVGEPNVDPKKIVVLGGFHINKGVKGHVHLENMTICHSRGSGIVAMSSFSVKDVIIEKCDTHGMVVKGSSVRGRCTNIKVLDCGRNGVIALNGGAIKFDGRKTSICGNCLKGGNSDYGLNVFGSISSTIQFVDPLTKEIVSKNNYGGGNWGCQKIVTEMNVVSQPDKLNKSFN
jgi:hypothetical protein